MNTFFVEKQPNPKKTPQRGQPGQAPQQQQRAHHRNFSGGPQIGQFESQQPQPIQQVQYFQQPPKPKQLSQSKLSQQQQYSHAYTQQNVSFDNSITSQQPLHNQSISYPIQERAQQQGRMKSYSQQQQQYNSNILDELNDYSEEYIPNYEEQINITLGKNQQLENQYIVNQSDQELKDELAQILGKTLNGQQSVTLSVDELSSVINLIEQCMKESQYVITQKDQEIQGMRKELGKKDLIIEHQKSQILSLKNEVSEIKEVINMRHSESSNNNNSDDLYYKLQQLEQENEMLRLENKQAIKLAVQGRNKKGEKELGELITKLKTSDKSLQSSSGKQVNNYSILLNQQYNKIYQQERKNSNKGSNQKQSFNLF